MKKKFLIILASLTFVGCEEVIQLDLNSSNPAIVIEANVTNYSDKNFVLITESTDFYNPNEYTKIIGANIIISDNAGNKYLLNEIEPGKYSSENLKAVPLTEYSINVDYNNQNYTARSSVPEPLKIDSLSYKIESRPFNKDKKFVELHVYFADYRIPGNYARFIVYKNHKKIDGVFLYNDRLTNGNYIDFYFFNFNDEVFNNLDTITVELLSIDETTFNYFKTLRNALSTSRGGPFGSTAPANPISNWTNNALGYFGAYTINSKSIILH